MYVYIVTNTYATFETLFAKMLCNTEADLKENVAYKKKRVMQFTIFLLAMLIFLYDIII